MFGHGSNPVLGARVIFPRSRDICRTRDKIPTRTAQSCAKKKKRAGTPDAGHPCKTQRGALYPIRCVFPRYCDAFATCRRGRRTEAAGVRQSATERGVGPGARVSKGVFLGPWEIRKFSCHAIDSRPGTRNYLARDQRVHPPRGPRATRRKIRARSLAA